MIEHHLWIIFTLIALFSKGISSFVLKIITEKKLNKNLVIIYDVFWTFILGTITILSFFTFEITFELLPFLLVLSLSFVLVFVKKFNLLSLENLSPSIVFINTRIFSSLLIALVSFITFKEIFTIKETIGFVFGILVFVLLFEKKDVPNKDSNFLKGFFYLSIVIIITVYLHIGHKISSLEYGVAFYLLQFYFLNTVFSMIVYHKDVKYIFNFKQNGEEIKYALYYAIFQLIVFIFLFKAYLLQNVAIVYKIFSFELFIPIILSIIFFKEKVNYKKIIAFILTIISILFFI